MAEEKEELKKEEVQEGIQKAQPTQPSKRDAFRGRFAQRYPDLNMDDEDAYYDAANNMFDEYEGYEKYTNSLRDNIQGSPLLRDMLLAAKDKEDFNPITWAIEEGRLDLDALREDPDYAKVIAEASKKALERKTQSEEIEKQAAENWPVTMDEIKAKASELGLSEDEALEIVKEIYQMMDDLIIGKVNMGMFEYMAKGRKHDEDVEQARTEGRAEGLSTKVDEKLRKMPKKQEHISGQQAPMKEARPKVSNNPFLA